MKYIFNLMIDNYYLYSTYLLIKIMATTYKIFNPFTHFVILFFLEENEGKDGPNSTNLQVNSVQMFQNLLEKLPSGVVSFMMIYFWNNNIQFCFHALQSSFYLNPFCLLLCFIFRIKLDALYFIIELGYTILLASRI